jgi:putative phosphoribosyl transferase
MESVGRGRQGLMERSRKRWTDRAEAGRALAGRFAEMRGRTDTTLVGLPRGGVAVAAAMAAPLQLPVIPWAVRKLTHPASPEFAIGAVAPGGVVLWDPEDHSLRLMSPGSREWLVREQRQELARRQALFGDPPAARLAGRHLIVVDDGVATGLTARAALISLRNVSPASLSLAVPVVDRRVLPDLEPLVDRLEALAVVGRLRAVGEWFERFEQLEDDEVIRLLALSGTPERRSGS